MTWCSAGRLVLCCLVSCLLFARHAHADSHHDDSVIISPRFNSSSDDEFSRTRAAFLELSQLGASRVPTWERVTDAPWSPRAGGFMDWYQPEGVAIGMFLLYGLGIYDQNPAIATEVWSSNTGRVWRQVRTSSTYSPLLSATAFQDKNGVQYRVQGTDNARSPYSDVYQSQNGGISWTLRRGTNLLPGTRYLAAGVALVSNPRVLVIWGGQQGGGRDDVLSDCWISQDEGANWVMQTDNVPWGQRAVHAGLSTLVDGVDVIYHMIGFVEYDPVTRTNVYTNDIWISTSRGARWTPMHPYAPFQSRGDAQVKMTNNGVIIVTSGVSSLYVGERQFILNDVWSSLDGGWSWGLCSADAPFSNRRFQYVGLDDKGVLYTMGGRDDTETRVNDVWKSTFSYSDINRVALECGLLVPSCGAGLKCLPNSPGFTSGMYGVNCDACPNVGALPTGIEGEVIPDTPSVLSTISNSTPLIAALSAFVILFVVAIAALYHVLNKMRQSGAAPPCSCIPSSWWSSGSSASQPMLGMSSLDSTNFSIQH